MAGTLQELEWENKTRLLFFKHRGNIAEIVKELQSIYENEVENVGERITVDFVKKVIKKYKKEQKSRDPFVATWILDYIFMGTKQREVFWDIDDKELERHKFLYRSVCCDAATEMHIDQESEPHFTCMKCDKICRVYRIPNLDVFEVQRKIRVEKRRDEEQLVKAAESLGFGGEKPPLIKQYNQQVVLPGENTPGRKRIGVKEIKELPDSDQELVENMKDMDPRDRETIRKNLEKLRIEEVGDGWPKAE